MENINVQSAMAKTTPIVCEKCGCDVFVPVYLLRRVNKLLIGAQKDGVIPIDTFKCSECGHINAEFIPSGLDGEDRQETQADGGSIIMP